MDALKKLLPGQHRTHGARERASTAPKHKTGKGAAVEGTLVTATEGAVHSVHAAGHMAHAAEAGDIAAQGAAMAEHAVGLQALAQSAAIEGAANVAGALIPPLEAYAAFRSGRDALRSLKSAFEPGATGRAHNVRGAALHGTAVVGHALTAAGVPGPGLAAYALTAGWEAHESRDARHERKDLKRTVHAIKTTRQELELLELRTSPGVPLAGSDLVRAQALRAKLKTLNTHLEVLNSVTDLRAAEASLQEARNQYADLKRDYPFNAPFQAEDVATGFELRNQIKNLEKRVAELKTVIAGH